MIFDRIAKIKVGTPIPDTRYIFDGVRVMDGKGTRTGPAAYYEIGKKTADRSSAKGVTARELEKAFVQLQSGEFTRKWFRANMRECNAQRCNFKAIGGFFKHLGEADYDGRGTYRHRRV